MNYFQLIIEFDKNYGFLTSHTKNHDNNRMAINVTGSFEIIKD